MSLKPSNSVRALGFSNRTTNALIKNGIITLGDLVLKNADELISCRGLGITGLEEIERFLDDYRRGEVGKVAEYTFGEFWQAIQPAERNFDILVDYYNNHPSSTLQSLSDKYGVSRERIRQLIAKGTKRLNNAFNGGMIKDDIVVSINKCANERTEVQMVGLSDGVFTGAGIAYLVSEFEPKKYKIYKSAKINGEWFVNANDHVDGIIDILVDELRYGQSPLLASTVSELYSISYGMLMSICGVIEKDGYVTHENNKIVMGKDRHAVITDYLDAINRPVSVNELVEHTNLSSNQVRGALCDKSRYINVGHSMYDLVDRKYEDYSVEELIKNLLTAENCAVKLSTVVKYIQIYRAASLMSITYILTNGSEFTVDDEYVLLKGWGKEKIVRKERKSYAVSLEDAVLNIINSSDEVFDYDSVCEGLKKYEGSVSMNPNSIKATLVRLAEKRKIARIGGARTGCYVRCGDGNSDSGCDNDKKVSLESLIAENLGGFIEIRYKTKRVRSDKKWRKISLRGQDSRFIYTNDLSRDGYRVTYLKERVVEYREVADSNAEKAKFVASGTEKAIVTLVKGGEYSNKDLREIFKVSGQCGMMRSRKTNSLVLVSRQRKDNPYNDGWVGDRFEYTGMGLKGDQSVDYSQNRTLAMSDMNGVTVYLFESDRSNSYIYRGIVELDGAPFFEIQKDITGANRKVVKFPLRLKEDEGC